MNRDKLILAWKAEEKIAHIHGWDFSHIDGRYTEQDDLPWEYRTVIRQYLRPEMKIMDIDTGGGEFLLSLNHPHENTAAMENYPPNVELCKEVLLPRGKTEVPFPDQYLKLASRKFEDAGFTTLRGEEVFRTIRFFDIGALVWFARIIQWEFPGFSVDTHLENLLNAQKILDEKGSVDGSIHRFLLVAQKQETRS